MSFFSVLAFSLPLSYHLLKSVSLISGLFFTLVECKRFYCMHCKEANKQHEHSSLQHANASLRKLTNVNRDDMLGFCQIGEFSVGIGWDSASQ